MSISLLLAVGAAEAAARTHRPPRTFVVNTTADLVPSSPPQCPNAAGHTSIRMGLACANVAGDVVHVPSGHYVLKHGQLSFSGRATLQGSGARSTIIDANDQDRVFLLNPGDSGTIFAVTLTSGSIFQETGGAGILVYTGAFLRLSQSRVTGNISNGPFPASGPSVAGGILNEGKLVVVRSTIDNNLAVTPDQFQEAWGGGIYNAGTLIVVNSTITSNSALNASGAGAARGGGIFNGGDSVKLTNMTLDANTATLQGGPTGLGGNLSGTATLHNTIVSGARAADGGNRDSAVTSLGHNLEDSNTCGLNGPGDIRKTNPMLGPLKNNGGLTDTQGLAPHSPAVNAAANSACPATDQRGVIRITKADPICDIGAFEFRR